MTPVNATNPKTPANLILVTVVAGLVIICAIQLLLFFQVRKTEEQSKTTSEKAERLIDFMTSDLMNRLASIGRLEVLEETCKKILSYYHDQTNEDSDVESQRHLATLFAHFGAVYLSQGKLDDGLASGLQSLEIRKKILSKNEKDVM